MSISAKFKDLFIKYNVFSVCRKKRMKKRLKNTTPTLLCPNCMGGLLFHDLGLQFRSPTVNTMIKQGDFIKFVTDMDSYLDSKLEFFKHPKNTFPCAKLKDITIFFTHYKSEEEAEAKWLERSKRIDRDNLFIVCSEREGITKEDILKLSKVKAKGVMVFTYNHYPDIPYAVQIKKYASNGEVGNILQRTIWNDSREYENYFDFVKWFNEANGGDFDNRIFAKK
ncbi:MAG: DUF1919 domain-containing protein [Clostridia bacterium]|nr:DUF1919 domain-containing protein [Clostridia bacterium]